MSARHHERIGRHDGSYVAFHDIHGRDPRASGISHDMDDQVAFGTARTLLHDVRFSAGDMADRSCDDLRGIQGRPLEKQGAHLIELLTESMAPGHTGSLLFCKKTAIKWIID